jgi:hypothetical protein
MKVRIAIAAGGLVLIPACGALLGVDDVSYEGPDATAEGGRPDVTQNDVLPAPDAADAQTDAAVSDAVVDAGLDAPPPMACDGGCVLLRVDGGNPKGLAIDDAGTIYVAMFDAGAIYSVREDGTGRAVAVSGTGGVIGLAVDDDLIYWGDTTTSNLRYAKKANTALQGAVSSVDPWSVKAGGGSVFWGEFYLGQSSKVMTYDPDSGIARTLATNEQAVAGVALDATQVYVLTDPADAGSGYLRRIPKSGSGATATSAAIAHGHHGFVSGNYVYFTAGAGVAEGTVYMLPVDFSDGQLPTKLATSQPSPWGIAVRGKTVYFATNDDGRINTTTTSGGPVFSLAVPCAGAFDLLLTSTALYASCSRDGTVVKFPGPP